VLLNEENLPAPEVCDGVFLGRTLGVSFRCRRFLVAVDPRLSFSLYPDAYEGLGGHPLRVCIPQDPEPIKREKNPPTARG